MPVSSRTLLDAIDDVIPHSLVSDVFQAPSAPEVYVDPAIEVEDAEDPFGAEVVLIGAPAAVGKSTVARYLAALAGIPLLDLAHVPVAAGSLRGLVGGYIDSDPAAVDALLQGSLTLVVDALDEGRIRSGEDAFIQFLFTAWELIERAEPRGPLIVMFGRPHTIADVEASLQIHNDDRDEGRRIRYRRVELSFFDEEGAVQLVKEYAKSADDDPARIERQWGAIEVAIQTYFQSIARALGLADSTDLWTDDLGRAFAGYAPVLAALGTLIALTPDYQRLTATLERDHVDAWAPIEEVIQLILDRESSKFRHSLAPHLTDQELLPETSYGPAEQIGYLLAHADGERQLRGDIPESLRGPDAEAYVNAINLMIPEHPFVRDGEFANPVFAGFALASGIFNETIDTASTREHLRSAARTPFLWRSFSNLTRSNGRVIAGSALGYLLTSRWNDPGEAAGPIHIASSGRIAEVAFPDNEKSLSTSLPIRFFERVQDLVAQIEDPKGLGIELAGEALTISGPVVLSTPSLRVATEKLFLEGSVWMETDLLEPRETLTLTVATEAAVGWNDTIDDHYPWSRTDTQLTHNPLVDPEPVNQLEAMIAEVVGHAPSQSVVVDAGNLSVAQDEPRWTWTKRQYEELFRRFLRLLVEEEKAVLRHIDTSANRPRARVIFRFSWTDMAKVVRGEAHDPELASVIQKAMDEFPQRLLYL